MSADHPGPLRRGAMRIYRVLPARPSQLIVRRLAPQYVVGAVVLLEHEGALLVLRQTHRSGLSLPGGLVQSGESPAQAAAREAMEETGIDLDPGDPVATAFDARLRHCDVIFRVPCDRRPEVRVASEATGYEWIDPDAWPGSRDGSTERIMRAVEMARATPREGRLR